jgi:hypothetical protein
VSLGEESAAVFFAPSDSPPRPRGHLKKLHLKMRGVFLQLRIIGIAQAARQHLHNVAVDFRALPRQ